MSSPAERAQRLRRWVDRFARQQVTVLGDFVADESVFGDISRISREAPILILEQTRRTIVPGGAGNSVANLRALGAIPIPVGVVGKDASGDALIASLRERKIKTSFLVRDDGYATPTKSRILAGGVHTRRQQVVRIDRGTGRGDLPRTLRTTLARNLAGALKGTRGLLIADYGYGAAAPQPRLNALIQRLTSRGLIVTVDSRERVRDFRAVTACSPNQEELELSFGGRQIADADIAHAGKKLLRATGNRATLVTRGAKGMVLFQRKQPELEIPAYGPEEVADVTGAGDTVIATLTLALIAGAPLADAARLANYAAGIVVQRVGASTLTPSELCAAIDTDQLR